MTIVADSAPALPRKPRVVVTRRLLPETEARMTELFDVRLNQEDRPMTRGELAAAMAECDVLVPTVTDILDAELIAAAGPQLGLIASFGAGTDHVDVAAAQARNIMVTNTPSVFTDDTADLTLALIIFVSRRFWSSGQLLRAGGWDGWRPSGLLGNNLHGKRLGIVGMGRIGQAVAQRARAFGLEIIYNNRNRLPEAIERPLAARYEPELDRLVAQADILTLHCPAADDTRHLMDARRLGLMKRGSFLINTGRGGLVDEEALIIALSDGHLGGAGLDVFANEPHVNPRLLELPNLVALPHLGSATHEGREAAGLRVVANICTWAEGHRPPDQVLPT